MKIILYHSRKLDVEIHSTDKAIVEKACRRLRLGAERIEAEIEKAMVKAVCAELPEFNPKTCELVVEEREEKE